MKNNKALIGIIVCAVFFVVIVCIGLSSKKTKEQLKETRGTLYKFNVEDFNYKLLGDLFYNIKYTGKYNGSSLEASVMLSLEPDLTCSYYANVKLDNGDSKTVLQDSCSYVITDENDLILDADVRTINYESLSDQVTNTNETINLNGEFIQNYKYLTIENLEYTNMDYSRFLKNDIKEILFDATAQDTYYVDGTKITGDEDEEPIKLDLSYFDIKTDTVDNVFKGMLSNKFFGIKYVKDIKVSDMDKLLNNDEYSVLYISQDRCSYCDDYEEELLKVLPYYQVYINRINLSVLNNEEYDKVKTFIFDKALV